ncbi:cohesin domain-containing protein [Ruminococcus flavefaciens]|uniref:Cohesin domain-containing protein n=1 Tax=Ruminococcus flavefaciens TaxID=1265 RepID=A0A1K1NX17_RUMFL|nr:cohesin domain-containing protein [Ruminococcus flavefaciens]SFW40066.1 Cohesin domain-containing protein [Ruminococcus flavefaciens]
MKTKKVVVGALAAMLSLSVCSLAPAVAAGETVQISVGKVNAEAGAAFSVDVSLADIPSSGIQCLDFAVSYDSKVLTIESIEAGALVKNGSDSKDLSASLAPLFEGTVNSSEGWASAAWSTSTDDASYWLKSDGVFCTIKGKVASGVANGTVSDLKIIPIDRELYSKSGVKNKEISCGYEKDKKPVKYDTTLVNGSVTVGTPVTTTTQPPTDKITRGDANCDGSVDMSDVVLIMQSLASPNKYGLTGSDDKHITAQGQANGDVDDSVKGITNGDALKIQKWLLKSITEL